METTNSTGIELTGKQQRFCEEYLKDMNATQAAIRSGYSEKTARVIGPENLSKPAIRLFIDAKLKEFTLSADETLKSISDIARASLNDYFIIKKVETTPRIEKHLSEIIKDIQNTIEDAEKFIERIGAVASVTNENLEEHQVQQQRRKMEILQLQIELERNPNGTRIVNGKPYFSEVAEIDIPRLVKDKSAGKIKTIKHTEFGLNVELYAADAALRDLARVHGLFEKDNEQGAIKIKVTRK